jgi:Competence-damaged protein
LLDRAASHVIFNHSFTPALVDAACELLALAKQKHLSIVTAESCTSGFLASVLSEAPGVAELLHGGFVAYTKQRARRLRSACRRTEGAVNGEVARAMAEGALARSPADLAAAITGVAGPSPDEDGPRRSRLRRDRSARIPDRLSGKEIRQDPPRCRARGSDRGCARSLEPSRALVDWRMHLRPDGRMSGAVPTKPRFVGGGRSGAVTLQADGDDIGGAPKRRLAEWFASSDLRRLDGRKKPRRGGRGQVGSRQISRRRYRD